MMTTTHTYTVTLDGDTAYYTLCWLADRGYDGGFMEHGDLLSIGGAVDQRYTFGFTEPAAWAFRDTVESDPHAFLSCCGSDEVTDALLDFESRIV